jgi:uncharacterized SAM-binding protein YcdF (DUF218 family)
VSVIATPMAILSVLVLFGIGKVWWSHKKCRKRLRWIAIPFLVLYVIHTWPVRYVIVGSLEWRYPLVQTVDKDVEAIVVLSGAVQAADGVRPSPELGANTIERCLHAAKLHKATPGIPILISGGSLDEGGPVAALLMRDFLIQQGVVEQQLLIEDRSRTTYENAVESARILRERGIQRIVLVTSATHMRRSVGTFEKQQLLVTPSACGHIASGYSFLWTDFFPDGMSAYHIEIASHEWLGIFYYRLRGRL